MKISLSNIVVCVAALAIGRCSADAPERDVVTVTDTVPSPELLARVSDLQIKTDGLTAVLKNRKALKPDTVLVTDTLVSPPDTVLQALAFSSNGMLSIAPLIKHDTLWAPQLQKFDVSRCDDGFSWAAGTLVCDRSRLGHFAPYTTFGVSVLGEKSLYGALGLSWKRFERSTWYLTVEVTDQKQVGVGFTRDW